MMYTTFYQSIITKFKKKSCFCIKTDAAHAEQKYYYKQFQFILFDLRKILIFKIIFIVERFINHNAHYRRYVVVISKYCDKRLSKF